MAQQDSTTKPSYTKRLLNLEYMPWKTLLDVQRPYRWNVKRLKPGITLDIGCGIGRHLKTLPAGSVGIDHNPHSIKYIRSMGLVGFTPAAFKKSPYSTNKFDTLLLSHVLEHMTFQEGIDLIAMYAPCIKKGGQIILFCPQEKGYASDDTHVTFHDINSLNVMIKKSGFVPARNYSFPLPRPIGKLFTYNEFVVTGQKL